MGKVLSVKPALVSAAPTCLAVVAAAVPEQEGGNMLSLPPVVLDRHGTCAHQVPDRRPLPVRNRYRGQLAGSQQTCQGLRIPPVRLDPVARPMRDKRRCGHHACMTKSQDLAIQPISGRTGSCSKNATSRGARPAYGSASLPPPRVVEFPYVANFPVTAALRYCNSIPQLGGIDPDKNLPIYPHWLVPLCVEARPGPPGQPSLIRTFGMSHPGRSADMRSY